jgi:class 3 adenylate cyclase/tetratricopeptide (TPR) repeat protein
MSDEGAGVLCGNCGAANPVSQRFCGDCGTPMARGCPNCAASNPPGQRFCGECGTALAATGSTATSPAPAAQAAPTTAAPRTPAGFGADGGPSGGTAERRLVSVLFADLVGFTPFAEERDAEDVREILTRYFDLASDVIARHGGTVEKFIGDAVMAVWGTPSAREDDAERAVRAALELVSAVRALGGEIQARGAVLTGEAAVTLGATNQGMVAGDLVNTAARLQGIAPAGAVLVGETTQRLASGSIVFEPVGEQSLKGKVAPVPAWRAVRVVAERGGRGRADALEAPFIGRDEELRLLKDLYHATVREQRTRLVSVTGIGGTGKSRLAWEFEKYLDGIVGTTWWHHGRSPAYGEGITFWALGEMIRQRARLAETDDEATTRVKLAEMVARVTSDDRERQWFLSSFLALFGIESGRSDELFGAWRTFFERMSATGPVVLVFEDLHWADSGTLDFIDHLLEWSRSLPLYIVTLARPELLDKRPTWGAARRSFTSLFLEPLPETIVRDILAGLVPGLPEPIVRAIVHRSEGIPLYAIETVRMLVDDGRLAAQEDGTYRVAGDVTELAVPPTLTALIAARLDALEAADRALVLDAAVLGQSFTIAGLASVSGMPEAELGKRLQALVRSELLRREGDPASPERGQYGFVQALVREVAYNTLSKKDRKNRHLAAARFFESLGTDEIAGALAGHYLAAHTLATEGGEQEALATQARLALRGAAERAASLGAHDGAVTFYSQAISVATDPIEKLDLLERAGESAYIAARWEDADRFLGPALDQQRARGDRVAMARVATHLGRALLAQYRVREAVELLTPIRAEVEDLANGPEVAGLDSQLARIHYFNGEPQRALEIADRVLAIAERLQLLPIVAETLSTRGGALIDIGRGLEGLIVAEGAIPLAKSVGLPHIALRAQNTVGIYLLWRDPRAAAAIFEQGIAEARRLGSRALLVRLTGNAIENARTIGDWDWSIAALDGLLAEPLGLADRIFAVGNARYLAAWRGEASASIIAEYEALREQSFDASVSQQISDTDAGTALADGRLDEARATWREASRTNPLNAPQGLALAGLASIWAGDPAGARADLAALDATSAHGGLTDARRLAIRAGIDGLEGRIDESAAEYRSALETFRALGLRLDEAFTAISMLTVLGPDHPDAATTARGGREIFVSLGARPFIERLDRLLAGGGRPPRSARGEPAPASQSA